MTTKKRFLTTLDKPEFSMPSQAPSDRSFHVHLTNLPTKPDGHAVSALYRFAGGKAIEFIGQMVLDPHFVPDPTAVVDAVCEALDRQIIERMN